MYGARKEHAEVGQLASSRKGSRAQARDKKADHNPSANELRTRVTETIPVNTGFVPAMPLAA